ncbi:hypothetical protein QFZ62_001878 [Clavibacter sp. B3I6]|nr:hypothetical protein [Clavibacter sp. B3I6]
MPLLNRSTRTKIVGALLTTAALSVGAGALPATAAPSFNPDQGWGTIFFRLRDGVKSVRVAEPEGGWSPCATPGEGGTTATLYLPLDRTYSAQGYTDTHCMSPVANARGDIDGSGSRTYYVHHWGFKKQ